MYSVDMKNAQLILRYSDVFPGEKPNLVDKIKNVNMHKTISIISELIQIKDAKCEPINIFGMEVRFPFEIILKRDYCGMKPESPREMMENMMMRKNQHIISLQMLLILLKKVIIYGNYESLKEQDYEIKEKEKISKVIDILMKKPCELREWAIKSEMDEWDFTLFYSFPFISDGQTNYISISNVTLINAFFEKIFWLIRDCYPQEDERAMAFFGRLFERYIQDATKDACRNLSIEEYEMLLYLIEQDIDIFKILREYFTNRVLSPFSNYVREKVDSVNMTRFMEENYKAATYKMESMLSKSHC